MRLFGIAFSPWTEKARWALDHHRLVYTYQEHTPVIGEGWLRWRMRQPTGRVTLPVLEADQWYRDSFDIARYADGVGHGPRLFPEDRLDELTAWNARSEAALAAGRALFMLRVLDTPSLVDAVFLARAPRALRPVLRPLVLRAMEGFVQKYGMREGLGQHEGVLSGALEVLAQALSPEQPYLLGAFSYADIAMALVLQGVSPVDKSFMPMGLGGRQVLGQPQLAARYKGLLQWRDDLYAKHRVSPPPPHGPDSR